MTSILETRSENAAATAEALEERPAPPKVNLFGVHVTKADSDAILSAILAWGRARRPATVDFFGVHGLTEANRNPEFMRSMNRFDIVACDGQPIRWALNRWHAARIPGRVYGPTVMLQVCQLAAEEGLSIYLYGSRPEVLERLAAGLRQRFGKLQIAGAESPPFRPLSDDERLDVADRINASGAAFVFIGLGCPKQELFAAEMADKVEAVQLCVGAAFDFHAGMVPMAPPWMQDAGLEWFYRLCQEPRRLWRRYLFNNSMFVGMCLRRMLFGGRRPVDH